jgi:hypothetical protein
MGTIYPPFCFRNLLDVKKQSTSRFDAPSVNVVRHKNLLSTPRKQFLYHVGSLLRCRSIQHIQSTTSEQISNLRKKKDEKKQKRFFIDLLSVNCDGDSYERCFEISVGHFLCRSCLCIVLQLSRRIKRAYVPSSKYILHQYRMICMADVFSAIVVYRTSVLQKRPTRRDGTYKQRIEWSHACFDEAKKKFTACIYIMIMV